jgi:hypothetical protein
MVNNISSLSPEDPRVESTILTYKHTPFFKLIDDKLRDDVIRQIQQMWQLQVRSNRFPGPQPVSLMRDQIPMLLKKRYYVAEKTDGVRYLLAALIVHGLRILCLIDRTCSVYVIQDIKLRKKNYPSLLDGELVFDDVIGWKFQLIDIMNASGYKDPKMMSFRSRQVLYHRFATRFQHLPEAPFQIQGKRQYPRSKLPYLLQTVIPNLTHQWDGLIFTPDRLPVQTGTHWSLFKVKTRHTIDLMARYVPDDPQKRVVHLQTQGHLNERGDLVEISEWPTIARQTVKELFNNGNIPELSVWQDQIVECDRIMNINFVQTNISPTLRVRYKEPNKMQLKILRTKS